MTRYQRRQQRTVGRIGRVNARPGDCRDCGAAIPAGAGELWREQSGSWSVVHRPAAWSGSPVSGFYAGGCPDETDRMNAAGKFGRNGQAPDSEHVRISQVARGYELSHPAPVQAPAGADLREVSAAAGPKYAYTNTGARVTMASARCIDAPCCGCCD
jgi:hypothetical protein